MDEPLPFYRRAKLQAVLVTIAVLLLYLLLLGRQGEATAVAFSQDKAFAYIGGGNEGGVRVLRLQNRARPEEIGGLDTPGSARKILPVDHYLFVADGQRGLRIIDISNPSYPIEVGTYESPGDALDIAVLDHYAYLALGGNGITILDISNPASPLFVYSLKTTDPPMGLAVEMFPLALAPQQGNQNSEGQIAAEVPLLFVPEGLAGLEIYNVLDPKVPVRLGLYDTPGRANAIKLDGPVAYLADGKGGLIALNISNPRTPTILSTADADRDVLSMFVWDNHIAAIEGKTFSIMDVSDPVAPQIYTPVELPEEIQDIAAVDNVLYVADGAHGVRILNVSKPDAVQEVGIYELPGEANFGQLLGIVGYVLAGDFTGIPVRTLRTLLMVIFDLVLFLVAMFFWTTVFAQFVLPVKTLTERSKAVSRLMTYLSGGHGPAIAVQNGEVKERLYEEFRHGPGVALFDSASAGVFRNAHAFTQVAGPGVVFTEAPEYLAGTIDLHRQAASIGPRENEDPFAGRGQEEEVEAYQARQDRRFETSGLTRDGVEIVPNISAFFGLDSQTGQGRTQFGFNPDSVRRAIASQGINPDALAGTTARNVPWTWLPARVAADMWREYLRKYTLDELFAFPASDKEVPSERRTAFDLILEKIRLRMSRPEVEELDERGQPTGIRKHSLEYDLLVSRGIKIQSVGVRNLRFPKEVEERLVTQWRATWLQRARMEAGQIEARLAAERIAGQESAVKQFAIAASEGLISKAQEEAPIPGQQLRLRDSLLRLLEGIYDLCSRDVALQSRLSNQKTMLLEMIEWIRKQPS